MVVNGTPVTTVASEDVSKSLRFLEGGLGRGQHILGTGYPDVNRWEEKYVDEHAEN